jgi:hypothetical protein
MSPGQFARKWYRLDARFRQLVAEGERPAEIARRLGVTLSAVRCRASVLGLKLNNEPVARPDRAGSPAPNVIPLVERAIAEDPAAAPPARVKRSAWPLHVAAYVANVELNCSTRSVGLLIGRDRKLVRYAVRQIEERRDEDPALDAFLDRLGERARELAA